MQAARFALSLLATAITANAHAGTEIMEETIVADTQASLTSAIDKPEMSQVPY